MVFDGRTGGSVAPEETWSESWGTLAGGEEAVADNSRVVDALVTSVGFGSVVSTRSVPLLEAGALVEIVGVEVLNAVQVDVMTLDVPLPCFAFSLIASSERASSYEVGTFFCSSLSQGI